MGSADPLCARGALRSGGRISCLLLVADPDARSAGIYVTMTWLWRPCRPWWWWRQQHGGDSMVVEDVAALPCSIYRTYPIPHHAYY